jgi:hypothetical protein
LGRKKGYLFYNVIDQKETAKAISPQFNILDTELICQILKVKRTFMRISGASVNNIFSVSTF